jgi:hypothetical protein
VESTAETARAQGKKLGRPRVTLGPRQNGCLRTQGLSWAKIAAH